jgi:hypothetical protein
MQDPFADIPNVGASSGADPFADIPTKGNKQKQDIQDMLMDYMKQSASTFENTALGAGDAVNNLLRGTSNMVMPKSMQVPMMHSGSGTGYGLGTALGDIAGFAGGGEGLGAVRGASEAIPYLGKIAEALGGQGASGVARRAVGSGTYGAIQNPDDRLKGFNQGAELSGALDMVPGALKGVSSISKVIRPQEYAKQILDTLGSGQSLESNAKSLAQSIQNSFKKQVGIGNDLYNPVFSSLGDSKLGSSIEVAGKNPKDTKLIPPGKYGGIDQKILDSYDYKIGDLHDSYAKSPILQNAHDLQSQLGTTVRQLQKTDLKSNLSIADRKKMQGYQLAQDALQNDIGSFLKSKNPKLSDQYNTATQYWRENVVPYVENPFIAKIAKGEVENPRNISTIFKNPEEGIGKIVDDLGDSGKNSILYAELGKLGKKLNPDQLLEASKGLDAKGLSSYVTPELSSQINTLKNRIGYRDLTQKGTGLLTGAALSHGLGAPALFDTLAGLGAAAASPSAMRFIQSKVPIDTVSAISKALAKLYKGGSKATIATLLGGQ